MGKTKLASVVCLACLLVVCGVVLAADGDLLKTEFWVGPDSTEKSSAESRATQPKAGGQWTINYRYNNKAVDGTDYVEASFQWQANRFKFSDLASKNSWQELAKTTNRSIVEIDSTLSVRAGTNIGTYTPQIWVPDPGVTYNGHIDDKVTVVCGPEQFPNVTFNHLIIEVDPGVSVAAQAEVTNCTDQTILVVLPSGESLVIGPNSYDYILTTDYVPTDALLEADGTMTVYYNYGTSDEYVAEYAACYWVEP
jgi:hypothetical protein